jgi:DNA segregation ATPase FtsK/SpoIIIE, S-DNA-T family
LKRISRSTKSPPLELLTAIEGEERSSRIARELSALGLIALALYGLLSLASLDAGRQPNLGGPFGAELAEFLNYSFGYQSYFIVVLVVLLARRIWMDQAGYPLLREAAGGAVLLIALSAAGGFLEIPQVAVGGALGAAMAAALGAYLNVGGGYIVVVLAMVGGLALMAGRAPTDLAVSFAHAARLRRRRLERSTAGETSFDGSADFRMGDVADASASLDGVSALNSVARDANLRLVRPVQVPDKTPRPRSPKGSYRLPQLSLLDVPPVEHARIDEAAVERSARVLEQKLLDFGVQGQVVEVQPGPVVTMYKLEPGAGVKVSQIVNLADDLSMALRAATVRILAPVPGEAVVGIEVPNRKREKVYLREILEADQFSAAQSQLMIALGKDISGQPVAADLATMPHLLIAGATGTGKSVSIHTMIASILFNATADDVRFILIDPKMLELSVYEGIPHLLVPVVVDPEKAAAALLWATREMEARYRMMRDLGVRNIDGYNRTLGNGGELVELRRGGTAENNNDNAEWVDTSIKHRKLPKILIVIDELADLLLSEGKTVERDITRLAQKARAAGIHLILATQRPSVDVITGLIKANLPARISLQVTSRVDSRTILDSIGAERLLGAGDMLFMPPGTAKLRRLHGPFVSETEIRKVCNFLRAQGSPDYHMEILETAVAGVGDGDGPQEKDDLYDESVRIVMETGQASISMIQRRLRIGYNRAARMVEQMEREGLVLPADGARPREVRMRGAN